MVNIFQLVPNPTTENDWLAQFNEPGQSCVQFMRREKSIIEEKSLGLKKFIYYIQIGDFDLTKLNFANLIDYSRCFFSEKAVKVMPLKLEISIDEKSIDEDEKSGKIPFNVKYGGINYVKKVFGRLDKKTKQIQFQIQTLFSLLD